MYEVIIPLNVYLYLINLKIKETFIFILLDHKYKKINKEYKK